MASDSQQRRSIVVIGGGIIGCTSAYFITRHPFYNPALHSVTILEATAIASGASGKAGGLLAQWAYPACIVPLSFRLHEQLAAEHNGSQRWGYRKIHSASLSAKVRAKADPQDGATVPPDGGWSKLPKVEGRSFEKTTVPAVPTALDWLEPEVITSYEEMGDPTTTAQVHPYEFTTSMATLAQQRGANIVLGTVKSINTTNNKVHSITYEDKSAQETQTLDATDIILSAGPWTSKLFPEAPITALRAHSITLKASVSPFAIFTDISLPPAPSSVYHHVKNKNKSKIKSEIKIVSPEIYPRPNDEVYACGEGDTSIPLPASTDLVQVDGRRCQDIVDHVSAISPVLAAAEVLVRQACYLPCVEGEGGPLIGPTGLEGLLLAAGHSCWGIQNSCATGMIMGEILWEGRAKSADVGSLDPRRVLGEVSV